jgi:6-phosphogluconolactonase/glucosamine-6-phosphate isomerase/deaminase
VLEAARHSVMLVTGSDKAAMLKAVLHGERFEYPAQIGAKEAEWYVEAAGSD